MLGWGGFRWAQPGVLSGVGKARLLDPAVPPRTSLVCTFLSMAFIIVVVIAVIVIDREGNTKASLEDDVVPWKEMQVIWSCQSCVQVFSLPKVCDSNYLICEP